MRIFGLVGLLLVLGVGFYVYQRSATVPGGKSPMEQIDTVAIRQRLLAIAETERQYLATHDSYATLEQLAEGTCCRAAPSSEATRSARP